MQIKTASDNAIVLIQEITDILGDSKGFQKQDLKVTRFKIPTFLNLLLTSVLASNHKAVAGSIGFLKYLFSQDLAYTGPNFFC